MAAAVQPLDASQLPIKLFDGLNTTYRPRHFLEAIEEKMIQTHGVIGNARAADAETTIKWDQRLNTFAAWLTGPAKEW